jgi:hypothetical protein
MSSCQASRGEVFVREHEMRCLLSSQHANSAICRKQAAKERNVLPISMRSENQRYFLLIGIKKEAQIHISMLWRKSHRVNKLV